MWIIHIENILAAENDKVQATKEPDTQVLFRQHFESRKPLHRKIIILCLNSGIHTLESLLVIHILESFPVIHTLGIISGIHTLESLLVIHTLESLPVILTLESLTVIHTLELLLVIHT